MTDPTVVCPECESVLKPAEIEWDEDGASCSFCGFEFTVVTP